jgi:FixJ family two-component response regulator
LKLHRSAITTKLRVRTVAELIRLFHEAGVFEGHPPSVSKE